MSSLCESSQTSLASVGPPSELTDAPEEVTFQHATWLLQTAVPISKKRGVKNRIWEYGQQYLNANDHRTIAWRCGICVQNKMVSFLHEATSNVKRHLREAHGLVVDSSMRAPQPMPRPGTIHGVIQGVNIDDVRFHLIRWIVEKHVPFSVVEDQNFQKMISAMSQMTAAKLTTSGDTVRNWIEDEFITAKKVIVDDILPRALSKIHLSCDLWSSPNGYAMCGIAAHFIGHQGTSQSVLLALRRMRDAHSGEYIGQVIIDVVEQYGFKSRLGVFVADNADTNDVAWRHSLLTLNPLRDASKSRSRCLGHIINLAAQAFLFGTDVEAFEMTVSMVNDFTSMESVQWKTVQQAWRRRGPIGKVHNLAVFIRSSPQRREAFKKTVVGESSDGKSHFS
jgi:hypothetical protein